ncbi:3-phosphoshikimate 1-carboxyvinyltransferase [Devosia sp. A449]
MTDQNAKNPAEPAQLASHGAAPMTGRFMTPGDQAISHAALLLSALTVGRSHIAGLSEANTVPAVMAILRQLGVRIERHADGWQVDGLGVGGLLAPAGPLELAQTGSATPLLLGLLAPYGFSSQLAGGLQCQSLMAALGVALDDDGETVTLRGPSVPLQVTAPSASTKAALLLAGAQIAGISTIVEPVPTQDHMEKLLSQFGGAVTVTHDAAGVASISVTGLTPLRPCHVEVPGDPSLAAYPLLAGLIVPGSDLVVENVLINPTRTGLIDTLLEMGGDIQFLNQHETGGEHVADLRVRSSRLKGVRVTAEHAAAMLDDIALLVVAAAYAQGETVIEGLADLRGARLDAIVAGLVANKVAAQVSADRLTIMGSGAVEGGGTVLTQGDAGMAMSFLVLGLASQQPVTIDDASIIDAGFPGFVAAMSAIGARFAPVKGSLS